MKYLIFAILLVSFNASAQVSHFDELAGEQSRQANTHDQMMKQMNPQHNPGMLGNRINRQPITHQEMMQQGQHGGYGTAPKTHKGMMCAANPFNC
ncbi:hypothetical protein [uncultured Paraglaciecola sp.]|uniref:hypothetical protein n=1 Tax=uncultured Paraglaciecola sp. TaxID=1765024 RepID=UPI00263095E6|nr:hypothetical protein [uncultured Paraglaciecola sp.]